MLSFTALVNVFPQGLPSLGISGHSRPGPKHPTLPQTHSAQNCPAELPAPSAPLRPSVLCVGLGRAPAQAGWDSLGGPWFITDALENQWLTYGFSKSKC